MSLEVYPADFSTRYEISHAISIQMSIYYNDVGKIQMVCVADDYNITALRKNYIIFDTDHNTTYLIVNVKCDTVENKITVNGYTAEYLLNKRVVATKAMVLNIETGVYDIINANMRDMTRIQTAAVKGLPEVFQPDDPETEDTDESVVYGDGVLDAVTPVLEYGHLGRRMIWDPSTLSWTFEIYKGRDLTSGIHAIAFAEEQGTCTKLIINEDSSTFRNVAYVTYRDRNQNDKLTIIGSATGDDRYELWLKSSVTQEEGESEANARKRAASFGQLELEKYINRQSFSVVVDASELGTLYNIGDIVSCSSVRFGVRFNARITGVTYTLDITGEQTAVQLGDPILTALGELILNNG